MNDTLRLIICTLIYGILISWSVCLLAEPATASDYTSNFKRTPAIHGFPPQAGYWHRTPTIIVCDLAPVTDVQMRTAVTFWENLGYKFLSTRYKRHADKTICSQKAPTGYIIIHFVTAEVEIDPEALAQTHFFVDNQTNEIGWATIYLRTDIRETVLEHELGHALGFLHFNRINHVMNEKWAQGGWDTDGLKKQQK